MHEVARESEKKKERYNHRIWMWIHRDVLISMNFKWEWTEWAHSAHIQMEKKKFDGN